MKMVNSLGEAFSASFTDALLYGDHSQTYIIGPGISVKHVLVNGDYTTVVWEDGSHTVVKKEAGAVNDPEKAILYAVLKKIFDNNGSKMRKYLKGIEDKTIVKKEKKGTGFDKGYIDYEGVWHQSKGEGEKNEHKCTSGDFRKEKVLDPQA